MGCSESREEPYRQHIGFGPDGEQIVRMTLLPGESVAAETHSEFYQKIKVLDGKATLGIKLKEDGETTWVTLTPDDIVLKISKGVQHGIYNLETYTLKMEFYYEKMVHKIDTEQWEPVDAASMEEWEEAREASAFLRN
jgi:quercetin dioxygenase-like cupin family protein